MQTYKILPKRRNKNKHSDFEIHDRNREGLN